ncbi:MAG TPA: histidine kinase [Anaerolineae bacterium]|nr:histidine kinase [Anaerolineae bacterium]
MQFYANSYAFASILMIILVLAIIAVMLRIESKSPATRFLLAFFGALLFNGLAMFWSNAGPVYRYLLIPTQDAFLIAGGVGLMGFAYHYPRNAQPREARLMLAGFSVIAAAAFAYNIYFAYDILASGQPRSASYPFSLLMPLALLVTILVFFRRAVHFANRTSAAGRAVKLPVLRSLWRPTNPHGLALRNFALALSVGLIQAVASAGLVTGTLVIHFVAIGAILAISAIALVYLNHAPEPVSFMVKLVGLSLVMLLMALGINGVNLIESRRVEQQHLLQATTAAALTAEWHFDRLDQVPAGVRYVVSWPRAGIEDQAAYQLHFGHKDEPLASSAAIRAKNIRALAKNEFSQPLSPDQPNFVVRDFLPSPVDYARLVAVQLLREDRVYEVGFLYAEVYLYPIHVEARRQSLMVILGSMFVIIVLPLFFRRTLVTPLDNLLRGIEQANTGQLDMALPVRQNDELGFLTRSFNRMVGSLRESRQALHDLTRSLEQQVKARTAELATVNERLEQQVRIRTGELSQTVELLQREIKERERAEAEIQRMLISLEQRVAARTQQLAAFFDLTVLASRAQDLGEVLQQALPRIQEVTRSRVICLHLWNVDHTCLEMIGSQNLPDEICDSLQNVTVSTAFRQWLRQPNDPLVTTALPHLALLPPHFHLKDYQTYLGAQIRVGTQPEGILSCYRASDRGFGLDEISVAAALAEQVGMMLEIHRLRHAGQELAVLEERRRLARDLHDSVTQSLYSLSLFARSGREAATDGDSRRLETNLAEIEYGALQALQEMRLLLYELRAPLMEQEGLVQALETRLNLVERRAGLHVDYEVDLGRRILPRPVELELYRLAIEALNNTVKHAHAHQVQLWLQAINRHVKLKITDDGCGFDLRQKSGGFGLQGMQERVERLGGWLEIQSSPGHGTNVSIEVELADE